MKKDTLATHARHTPIGPTAPEKETWVKHKESPQCGKLPTDHFVQQKGLVFAGTHLIVDLWGGKHLNDLTIVENALRQSVKQCNATLLHLHLHHFSSSGGISGVAVLAESHISVHTWPERHFAAFDIFMCGKANPQKAISVLKNSFTPKIVKITRALRGVVGNG